MTKEGILNKHVHLYFSSHHDKSGWNGEGEHGGAEWHTHKAIAPDIYKAMDEYAAVYAKQQAIAFDFWKRQNGYTIDASGEWYIRLILSGDSARTEPVLAGEVYNQFIEQQNKQ